MCHAVARTTPQRKKLGVIAPSPKRVAAKHALCGRKRSLEERAEEEQELHRQLSESGIALQLQVDVDTMEELKADVYARCSKKRKMMSWAKCPKFILDPLIDRMIVLGKMTPVDTFLDIGSGIGNVVESVATRVGCDATGVEIVKPNHDVAMAAKPLFEKYREEHTLYTPTTTYMCADVTKMDMDIITDASVIWCSNKLFPLEVNVFLIDAFKQCKPGTRIFVMNNIYNHSRQECPQQQENFKYFTFTDFAWGAGDVEWTNEPGAMFMYKRTDYVPDEETA